MKDETIQFGKWKRPTRKNITKVQFRVLCEIAMGTCTQMVERYPPRQVLELSGLIRCGGWSGNVPELLPKGLEFLKSCEVPLS